MVARVWRTERLTIRMYSYYRRCADSSPWAEFDMWSWGGNTGPLYTAVSTLVPKQRWFHPTPPVPEIPKIITIGRVCCRRSIENSPEFHQKETMQKPKTKLFTLLRRLNVLQQLKLTAAQIKGKSFQTWSNSPWRSLEEVNPLTENQQKWHWLEKDL